MIRLGWIIVLLFLIVSPSNAQIAAPINVFVEHDRQAAMATIHFTNPASGLSTPVVLSPFRQDVLAIDELTVTSRGVLFRNPVDGLVMIATPDGQIFPHSFIPQQRGGLLAVAWVLSPDGNSIAWAESFLLDGAWVSNMYVSDIAGTSIIAVPPLPPSTITLIRRVVPLALTNDRQVVFYDNAFPTDPRPLTEHFVTYRELYVYSYGSGKHEQLPNEPTCACGAGVRADGFRFLRLEPTDLGFQVRLTDLSSGATGVIPAVGERFGQAGDVLWLPDGDIAFYTQAQNLESNEQDRQFALMRIDLLAGIQEFMVGPTGHRLRALSITGDGESLLVADVYEGTTYKLDLASQKLSLVSDSLWLGTIYQD